MRCCEITCYGNKMHRSPFFIFFLKFLHQKLPLLLLITDPYSNLWNKQPKLLDLVSKFQKNNKKEGENIPLFKSDTGVEKGKFQARFRFSSFFSRTGTALLLLLVWTRFGFGFFYGEIESLSIVGCVAFVGWWWISGSFSSSPLTVCRC